MLCNFLVNTIELDFFFFFVLAVHISSLFFQRNAPILAFWICRVLHLAI